MSLPASLKECLDQTGLRQQSDFRDLAMGGSSGGFQKCSIKKAVLKNFAILTGYGLCWSLFLTTFIKERLQHRCFPVNIATFLRAPILMNTWEGMVLEDLFYKTYRAENSAKLEDFRL